MLENIIVNGGICSVAINCYLGRSRLPGNTLHYVAKGRRSRGIPSNRWWESINATRRIAEKEDHDDDDKDVDD